MKAKTRIKKLSSLLLAVVMLLGILPAGAIGVYAADGALVIGDNDPAGTVYTIYGPKDWATVAAASAAGNTFAGMKVELGASIGGTEAEPLTLVPLFTAFLGEFDGNSDLGYSISNVNVTATVVKGLLAASIGDNTTEGTPQKTKIHHLTVTNTTTTISSSSNGGFLCGLLYGDVEVSDITLINPVLKGKPTSNIAILAGSTDKTTKSVLVERMTVTGAKVSGVATRGSLLIGLCYYGNVTVNDTHLTGVIDNVATDLKRTGGFFGALQDGAGTVSVTDSSVDMTITSTSTKFSSDDYTVGLGAGVIFGAQGDGVTVTFDGCDLKGTLASNSRYMGGVVGLVKGATVVAPLVIEVKDTTVDVEIDKNNGNNDTNHAVGGAIGAIKKNTAGSLVDVKLTGVSVQGTVETTHGIAGGLIGLVHESTKDDEGDGVDVVATDCDILPNIISTSAEGSVGMVIGQLSDSDSGNVTVTESTIGGSLTAAEGNVNVGTIAGYSNIQEGYAIMVNNSEITTKIGEAAAPLAGMTEGQDIVIFESGDNATLKPGYVQHTVTYTLSPEEGDPYTAYAIRFIALSALEAPSNAGIKIVVKNADGDIVAKFNTLECKAYDSLIGYATSGAPLDPYNAKDYDAQKFLAVIIEDIPTGTAYNFEVTPHYEPESGVTVYGETRVAQFDADGNLTNAIN